MKHNPVISRGVSDSVQSAKLSTLWMPPKVNNVEIYENQRILKGKKYLDREAVIKINQNANKEIICDFHIIVESTSNIMEGGNFNTIIIKRNLAN